jgi:hypothetical protein
MLLNCKLGAKYSAHPRVKAMRSVVPYIHNVIAAPHIRLQYSTERLCADIRDISTILCALYCKLGAKYSAHSPVYAMTVVLPDMYNVFTAPHIKASLFS